MISKETFIYVTILKMQGKRNERYWTTIDVSRLRVVTVSRIKKSWPCLDVLAHVPTPKSTTREGVDDWKTILEVLHRDCKKSRGEWGLGKSEGGKEEETRRKGLPVCRSELCERNDVNTRLCCSSMQRLSKSAGCGQGGFAGNREGQIKSTRDLRT